MDATLLSITTELLKKHEGYKQFPYLDTAIPPKITIGIGFNLTDVGLYDNEITFILNNRISMLYTALVDKLPWFADLDNSRKAVMIDMAFNLGVNGLLGFKRMLVAMQAKQYQTACQELLNSSYAKQVKNRAIENARIILHGEL